MINKISCTHFLIKRTRFNRFPQLFKLVNGKKSYELIANLHFIYIYLGVTVLIKRVKIAKLQIFIIVLINRFKLQITRVIYIIKTTLNGYRSEDHTSELQSRQYL